MKKGVTMTNPVGIRGVKQTTAMDKALYILSTLNVCSNELTLTLNKFKHFFNLLEEFSTFLKQ